MEEIRYLMWLVLVFGTGSPKIWTMLNLCGTAKEAVTLLQHSERDPNLHLPDYTQRRVQQTTMEQADGMIARCEAAGQTILTYQDPLYPEQLLSLANPPVLLFCQGNVELLRHKLMLTVVGTRKASEYSLRAERRICSELITEGFLLVTGFAVGCDITANLCALEMDKPSVAILGCGLDIAYPQTHANLRQSLQKNGLLLTEFFPGTTPAPVNFPMRNRILAAMSLGTFVIQAPERSGALITASDAVEMGRDVFCIPPADIFDKRYSGVIKYLRDGAIPVFDSRDILFAYYQPYASQLADTEPAEDTVDSQKKPTSPKREEAMPTASVQTEAAEPQVPAEASMSAQSEPVVPLEGEQGSIMQLIQEKGTVHIDDIAQETGIPMSQLTVALTELELFGKIERMPGKRFRLLAQQ